MRKQNQGTCLLPALWTALWLASVVVGPVEAEVVVTRNGEAAASIVSNGHVTQAKSLQEYLQKISGAELPIVAARADVAVNTPRAIDSTAPRIERSTLQSSHRVSGSGRARYSLPTPTSRIQSASRLSRRAWTPTTDA